MAPGDGSIRLRWTSASRRESHETVRAAANPDKQRRTSIPGLCIALLQALLLFEKLLFGVDTLLERFPKIDSRIGQRIPVTTLNVGSEIADAFREQFVCQDPAIMRQLVTSRRRQFGNELDAPEDTLAQFVEGRLHVFVLALNLSTRMKSCYFAPSGNEGRVKNRSHKAVAGLGFLIL